MTNIGKQAGFVLMCGMVVQVWAVSRMRPNLKGGCWVPTGACECLPDLWRREAAGRILREHIGDQSQVVGTGLRGAGYGFERLGDLLVRRADEAGNIVFDLERQFHHPCGRGTFRT